MSAETTTTPTTIEHLDYQPACRAEWLGCGGVNPATYLVAVTPCPHHAIPFCSACIARKVAQGAIHCHCEHTVWGFGPWLNFVTLHHLGGTP